MRSGTLSPLFTAVNLGPGTEQMLNAFLMNEWMDGWMDGWMSGWMKDRAVLLRLHYAHESTKNCMKLQTLGIMLNCWDSAFLTSSR